MKMGEKLLLPPMRDDDERQALVAKWTAQRGRNAVSHLLVVHPGQDGWVPQRGNRDPLRRVFYLCIERDVARPMKPRSVHHRSW